MRPRSSDVRKAGKRGKDLAKLRAMLTLLIDGKPLPERCRDHALQGGWSGFRDAHIEPDWLLIYRIDGEELQSGNSVRAERSLRQQAKSKHRSKSPFDSGATRLRSGRTVKKWH